MRCVSGWIRLTRSVASYRCNLSTISLERSSPVSILWQSPPRLSLQPPAERPHVFPPNECAGAAAVIFRFYYLCTRSRDRNHLGCARSAGFDYWDSRRASSNGPSVRGTLSRGAHLVLGEEYAHFHRFPAYARNW